MQTRLQASLFFFLPRDHATKLPTEGGQEEPLLSFVMHRFVCWEMMVGTGCLVAAAWEKVCAHQAEQPAQLVPHIDSQQAVLGLFALGTACTMASIIRPLVEPWAASGPSQIFYNGQLWDGTLVSLTCAPLGCPCSPIEAIVLSNLRLQFVGRQIPPPAECRHKNTTNSYYRYDVTSSIANILNIQEHTMFLMSNDPEDVSTYLSDGIYLFRNMDVSTAGWLFEKRDEHVQYKFVDIAE
jgi:hypothetical protein